MYFAEKSHILQQKVADANARRIRMAAREGSLNRKADICELCGHRGRHIKLLIEPVYLLLRTVFSQTVVAPDLNPPNRSGS